MVVSDYSAAHRGDMSDLSYGIGSAKIPKHIKYVSHEPFQRY